MNFIAELCRPEVYKRPIAPQSESNIRLKAEAYSFEPTNKPENQTDKSTCGVAVSYQRYRNDHWKLSQQKFENKFPWKVNTYKMASGKGEKYENRTKNLLYLKEDERRIIKTNT